MIPSTMCAARLHVIGGNFQIDQMAVPSLRPTDVLVRVEAAGIVPNLRNVVANYPTTRPFLPLPKLPAVFGLDSAGVIAAVGEGVSGGLRAGERVYVNPALSCGGCQACRSGEPNNCPDFTFMGYFGFGRHSQTQFDAYPYGGFSEYLTAPAANVVKLPDNISFEQACRFGYLGTSYSGLRKLDFRPGQTLLVNGATGTLGVGAVLLGLAMGASRIFITGRDRTRLENLKKLAPERIDVIAGERSVASQVLSLTEGYGADAMLEALAFQAPAAKIVDAINAVRRGGKVVNVGGVIESLPLDPSRMMAQQKSFIGSLWFTTAEGEELAAITKSGALRLDVFDTQVFPLTRINDALAAAGSNGGFSNVVICHREIESA